MCFYEGISNHEVEFPNSKDGVDSTRFLATKMILLDAPFSTCSFYQSYDMPFGVKDFVKLSNSFLFFKRLSRYH